MADTAQSTAITSLLPNTDSKSSSPIISEQVIKKLYFIAIFNILIGIISIGIDIGLLVNDAMIVLTGSINGLYMIFVGILILLLHREQVYVLTSLFILVFFQIFFLLPTLTAYTIGLFTSNNRCRYSYYEKCPHPMYLIMIIVVSILIILMTLCMTIYNLIVIRNGRRSHATYDSHQMMTQENV